MPAGPRALALNIRKTNKCTLYPQPIHQTAYIFGYTDIRIRVMGGKRNCGAETSDHSHPSLFSSTITWPRCKGVSVGVINPTII
jgi:hypothetical protein